MQYFETHLSNEKVTFKLEGNELIIKDLKNILCISDIMIFTTDTDGNEYNKVIVKNESYIKYKIKSLRDGIYFLNIFFKKDYTNMYESFFFNRDLPFVIKNGMPDFIHSVVFDKNRMFYANLKTGSQDLDIYLHATKNVQSDHPEIIALAKKITRKCLNTYQKLVKIHDWVAENIYYDMDSMRSGRYVNADNTALNTYHIKRSVCQGYSNLSVALYRAAGIPAVGMMCFALGLSTNGGWELSENLNADSNHIVTFAYVDYRWVIMDVTWDSDNIFENGGYHKKRGLGVSHKYLDTTLAYVSNTHRFTDEWLW